MRKIDSSRGLCGCIRASTPVRHPRFCLLSLLLPRRLLHLKPGSPPFRVRPPHWGAKYLSGMQEELRHSLWGRGKVKVLLPSSSRPLTYLAPLTHLPLLPLSVHVFLPFNSPTSQMQQTAQILLIVQYHFLSISCVCISIIPCFNFNFNVTMQYHDVYLQFGVSIVLF